MAPSARHGLDRSLDAKRPSRVGQAPVGRPSRQPECLCGVAERAALGQDGQDRDGVGVQCRWGWRRLPVHPDAAEMTDATDVAKVVEEAIEDVGRGADVHDGAGARQDGEQRRRRVGLRFDRPMPDLTGAGDGPAETSHEGPAGAPDLGDCVLERGRVAFHEQYRRLSRPVLAPSGSTEGSHPHIVARASTACRPSERSVPARSCVARDHGGDRRRRGPHAEGAPGGRQEPRCSMPIDPELARSVPH